MTTTTLDFTGYVREQITIAEDYAGKISHNDVYRIAAHADLHEAEHVTGTPFDVLSAGRSELLANVRAAAHMNGACTFHTYTAEREAMGRIIRNIVR